MTALVRDVRAASTPSPVMHAVCASTSTGRGIAPTAATAEAVGTAVNAGTKTSSPTPTPVAARASCSALAPDDTAAQCGAPSQPANSVSNADSSAPSRKLPLAAIRSAAFANAAANRCPRRLRSTTGTTGDHDRRLRSPEGRHRVSLLPSIREFRRWWCRRCGTSRYRFAADLPAKAPIEARLHCR